MISHHLLEVSLNHVSLCIFEEGISSRFRKYQVLIEYIITSSETEAFSPLPLIEKQGRYSKF